MKITQEQVAQSLKALLGTLIVHSWVLCFRRLM